MSRLNTVIADSVDFGAHDCGVLYIAFGRQYVEEAKSSLASLRTTKSTARVAVITDKPWTADPRPDHFVLRGRNLLFASRPEYAYEGTPFERTLLVDTDTYFARAPDRIFGMLDQYELGGLFAGPQLRDESRGLYFHPKMNGGVILFRKHPKVAEMFRLWKEGYGRKAATEEPEEGWIAPDDQRALTLAVIYSGVRHVHLGDWMNFVLWRTSSTLSPPVILHGRDPNMKWVADKVSGSWDENSDWRQRVWIPHIRGLLPGGGVGWVDPVLRFWCFTRKMLNWFDRRKSL